MEIKTIYFEKPGEENTKQTLEIVHDWADRLDIETLLIASTTGKTGIKALDILKGPRKSLTNWHPNLRS